TFCQGAVIFFFSSRSRHTRWPRDWSSDVCSTDLACRSDGHRPRPACERGRCGGRRGRRSTRVAGRPARRGSPRWPRGWRRSGSARSARGARRRSWWRRQAPAERAAPRRNPPPTRQRARAPERTQAPSRRPPPEAVAEEAPRGPAVRVPVVGDVPHVVVHPELPELLRGDFRQTLAHVRDVLVGGRGPVVPPDHHGHPADLTLRDPADLVLVIPRGDPRGTAEIAAVDAG